MNNTATGEDLTTAIESIRKNAPRHIEEWGSCEVTVGPSNALAIFGVRQVDGVVVHVEHGVKFIDKADIELDGPLVHFHRDDHSMFGSKGGNSDDPDDWPGDEG